jgi:HlyD family secretion protein
MAETRNLHETQVLSLADIRGEAQKTDGQFFTLTVIEGRDFGGIFQIESTETTIGRKDPDDNNKPNIELDDDRISRRHLMLTKKPVTNEAESFAVTALDLDSTNGTYINGFPLPKRETKLKNNDKIQIGDTVLKFEIKDSLDVSYQERLYQQVTRDAKTGLWNHNYARQEIERFISLGNRNKSGFSLLLVEVDYMQILNDTYGLTVGDGILRTIAQAITSELSGYEIAARFAGKQFLILLPEANMASGVNTADRIRKKVEEIDFTSVGCMQKVTVSAGVSQFPVCSQKAEDLIKQADEALYRAKQNGRNRTIKAMVVEEETRPVNKKILVSVLMLAVIAALVTIGMMAFPVLSQNPVNNNLTASGTVEVNEVKVGSKIGGRITEVLIQEGQQVKAGQPLVRFDIADLQAEKLSLNARIAELSAEVEKLENGFRKEEKDAAEAEVRKAQAILEQLRNGSRPQEIAQVQAEISAAESDLFNSESSFTRIDKIFSEGYQSKQVRDDAETRVKLNKSRLEALRQRLSLLQEGTRYEEIKTAEQNYQAALARAELLRAGTRKEDIAAAKARLDAAKAALAQLNVRVAEGEILSPADSRVEVVRVRPGDIIVAGNPIAKLLEPNQIWVRVYIPHTDIGKVRVGQTATINVDSFANKTFSGVVSQIAGEAEFYPRNVQTRTDREHQVFAIKVNIDDKDGSLKSGMSADVVIAMGK